MKMSVIITLYKNIPFVDLILKGLKRQTHRDFEVIIAEDDNAPATLDYLAAVSAQMPYPILHISHEDLGFRKNVILNRAVAAAGGEFLIFLDGDCIPHSRLVKEYHRQAAGGILFAGRRLLMSGRLTQQLLETGDFGLLSLFNQARYGSTRLEDGIYLPFYKKSKSNGLMGCNWGILKKHIVDINGFDEDYTSYGVGEDVDIEWRLLRSGARLQSMKHRAIVYHLYHRPKLNEEEEAANANYDIMKAKQALGNIRCINGLDKHLRKQ